MVCARQGASFALTVDQTVPNLSNKETDSETKTRIDFYAAQIEQVAPQILKQTKVGLFDGCYAKLKFVSRMEQAGFTVISPPRSDANLKYLHEGEQKPKGRYLKRKIKLIIVKYEKRTVDLFSTDLEMNGSEIFSSIEVGS